MSHSGSLMSNISGSGFISIMTLTKRKGLLKMNELLMVALKDHTRKHNCYRCYTQTKCIKYLKTSVACWTAWVCLHSHCQPGLKVKELGSRIKQIFQTFLKFISPLINHVHVTFLCSTMNELQLFNPYIKFIFAILLNY